MASPLYSALLARVSAASAGTYPLGAPPSGFIWVVRDVHAFNTNIAPLVLNGWILEDSSAVRLCGQGAFQARAAVDYDWQGRQVVPEGDSLQLVTFDTDWEFRISGYVLTSP